MVPDGMKEAVMNNVKQMVTNGTKGSFSDDVQGFVHAIDWSEQWLRVLAAFHVCVWLLVFFTRRINNVQIGLLLSILALVYSAEWINHICAQRWHHFSGQNYFDKRGVFFSVMFSTPLLIAAFVILINALRNAAHLLIAVKKQQFKSERRDRARGCKKAPPGKKD